MAQPTDTTALDPNHPTLAYVVEGLIIANHYRAGHGPQLREGTPPIGACEVDTCVRWRRWLAQVLP